MIIGIDTETTGLYPNEHAILSVGVAYRRPDGSLSTREFRCAPRKGAVIDAYALAVNGFSEEEICWWPPPEHTAGEVRNYLVNIVGKYGPSYLAAWNRAFDQSFLERMPWSLKDGWWGTCVMEAYADEYGNRMGLKDAVDRFLDTEQRTEMVENVPGGHHNAAWDAAAVVWLAERLSQMEERKMPSKKVIPNELSLPR